MGNTQRRQVDLNVDIGEGFGRWRMDDLALLDLATSANVACGFHAGDPVVMAETVKEAARRGVVIGAHPGYPDLIGFGRRELAATPEEIRAYVTYQIGALAAFCAAAGSRLRYVKPHGALYNRAVKDVNAAHAIAVAIKDVDPSLALLGLSGSELVRAAEREELRAVNEGFIDRGYRADGTLQPRDQPFALIDDVGVAAERAVKIVVEGAVECVDGASISIAADSLCVHGDGARAVDVLRAARSALESSGVTITPFVQNG
jgi:5-oxoprolinase (ATP-hydrolysing) subunit A